MSDEPITNAMEYARAQQELAGRCTPDLIDRMRRDPRGWGLEVERCVELLTGAETDGMLDEVSRRFLQGEEP